MQRRPSFAGDLVEQAARVRMLMLDVDGVLTDGRLWYGPDGEAFKAFDVRDGQGLIAARKAGLLLALASSRGHASVQARARDLGIDETLLNLDDKSRALELMLSKYSLEQAEVCYVGDDLPDLPVLERVGLPLTVPHAPAAVREVAAAITESPGGRGAVREVCDLLLAARLRNLD